MECYRIDMVGKIVPIDGFSETQAIELLRQHPEASVDRELSIGVCRDNQDFVEISYYGKGIYSIHTDTLCNHRYRAEVRLSLLRRMFTSHLDLDLEVTEEQAFDILGVYINGTRKEFEDYLASLKYPNKRWAKL